MAISQNRSKRKSSGGRYRHWRKKKLRDLARLPTYTGLGERKIMIIRETSGSKKVVNIKSNIANVYDPKTKKYHLVKIETIVDNPANRHFIKRNIMTKGAIIKTQMGNAKITSRPGQEGTINAVLVE